jgi:hypothetical protein
MGVGGQRHAPAALLPGKWPGTHCIGSWVGTRAGLDGCGKSRPIGIRSPDRPARSESLYRLNYHGPRPKTGLDILEKRARPCTWYGLFRDNDNTLRLPSKEVPRLLSRLAFGLVPVGLRYLDLRATEAVVKQTSKHKSIILNKTHISNKALHYAHYIFYWPVQ